MRLRRLREVKMTGEGGRMNCQETLQKIDEKIQEACREGRFPTTLRISRLISQNL